MDKQNQEHEHTASNALRVIAGLLVVSALVLSACGGATDIGRAELAANTANTVGQVVNPAAVGGDGGGECNYSLTPGRDVSALILLLEEHHNYLDAPVEWDGSGKYVIVNTYTRMGYQWDFWGNFDGRARFGVPTSYTVLNNWMADSWVIVFSECPE